MTPYLLLSWTVLVLALTYCGHSQQQHEIYIDSANGSDNKLCLTGVDYPCKTLNFAFSYQAHFTTYVLLSESYNITQEVSFSHLRGLKFTGKNTEVHCVGDGVGFAFINVTGVLLDGITFRHCAATRNCTSKQFTDEHSKPWCTFKVGLYFYLCENVELFQVTVAEGPNAIGAVMYDTGGVNSVTNSSFINNSVSSPHEGGGGFYVEFTYCSPGSINCNDTSHYNKHSVTESKYNFDNVIFENNWANNSGINSNSSYITPYKSNHQSFGRGGGLCIYINGQARSNAIDIKNCMFKNNTALWGAGMMLEFHDETIDNSIYINGCSFEDNRCIFSSEIGTGGGGIRIGHYVLDLNKTIFEMSNGNNVFIGNCYLSSNHAMYGGGLSISPALEVYDKNTFIHVDHVTFENNVAKFGSAIYVSRYPFSSHGVMLDISFKNIKLFNNSINYTGLIGQSDMPHIEGIGAIYVNQVNVAFNGSVWIDSNYGTGIAVAGSLLDFTNSNMTFTNNVGYRGGGICLLGSAQILIDDETTLTFQSNVAKVLGGAMYIRYVEMDNSKTFFNCFIKHLNPFLNPNHWKTKVTFINNTDKNGNHNNSIHSTSIYPCGLAGGTSFSLDRKNIFCWSNWKYFDVHDSRVECSEEITTDAGFIEPKLKRNEALEVIPGHTFELPFIVTDDYGNDVSDNTVFSAVVSDTRVKAASYAWNNSIFVAGNSSEVENIVLSLESISDVIWRTEIALKLQQCPPGLQGDECLCSDNYGGILNCDSHSSTMKIQVGYWIGFIDHSYLVGLCPPGFCKQTIESSIILHNTSNTTQIETVVCQGNRSGVLCGKCTDGYGPSVNSKYNCVECGTNKYISIVKYMASVYLPLITLLVILIVFDIRLTTGPVNGFILFSQMVTTTFTLDAYGQIPFDQIAGPKYELLKKFLFVPYGIFNLEFAENLLYPFCLSPNGTALNVIVLEYVVASFPLLMIIVATLCLKLKEFCCSACPKWSIKIVKRARCCKKINFTQALLPAFASFLMLSYHKFSLTSVYLLSSQSLIKENGDLAHPDRVYFAGHLNMSDPHYVTTYFIPSVLVLIFLFIFPIFLLGYPLIVFEKCLSTIKPIWKFYPAAKIHFFLDTFHGCYKMKLGFFSGLYFFFRLSMNITYLSAEYWIIQFVVQQLVCVIMITLVATIQPYKERYLNFVDSILFANLAFLNTLSLYMYFTYQSGRNIPPSAFFIQYALTALPLLYIIGFVIYYIWKNKFMGSTKLQELGDIVRMRRSSVNRSDCKSSKDSPNDKKWLSPLADEELFARANSPIKYNCNKVTAGESDSGLASKTSGYSSSSNLLSSEGTGYGTMSSGNSGTSLQ